jgi:hypothetical protein
MFSSETFSEYSFSDVFQSARVSLYGFAAISVSREFRIFSATSEFVTKSTDALVSMPFFGTLVQPLSFTRSLLGSDIIGNFSSGVGELSIANTDGVYDFLPQTFAIDGRAIVVKVGREGDAYDNFYTIFNGTASDWVIQEDNVIVKLVDNGYLLDVTVQPNLFAGTAGLEGTADLTGKRKPRTLGTVYNISPPLVIPSSLLYQVNDGPVFSIDAVYDRGVALVFYTNYANSASLLAASIPAGQYATCVSEGLFRLNTVPTGTVCADVHGDNTNGVYARTSADIVRRILLTSKIADPLGLYLPSFDIVNNVQPATVGYYIAPDDTNTIADAIANIMGGVGGWGGFRRTGQFEVGIFLTPIGVTPNVFIDRTDVLSIQREALPSALTPPPYRFRCGYQHVWTVQTDVAASVGAARKGFLAEADRYSSSINLTVKIDHPFAHDRDPIPSRFATLADAQTESDRLLALYARSAALYRFTVGVEPFALDIGDVINLKYPRWDLTVGKNLRIVEFTENAASNTIELVAYG